MAYMLISSPKLANLQLARFYERSVLATNLVQKGYRMRSGLERIVVTQMKDRVQNVPLRHRCRSKSIARALLIARGSVDS